MRLISITAAMLLSACASQPTQQQLAQPHPSAKPIDIAARPIEVATHQDLLAAAAYAEAHGYPARAAMRRAQDSLLTAAENQVSACLNSIKANLPQAPASLQGVGPILAAEMAEEAIGQFTGPSPAVKILCAPIPVPILPVLPKP